jgi:hypothetical protein
MRLSSAARRRFNLLPSKVTPRRGDEGLASTLDCILFNPTHISEYRNRIFYLEKRDYEYERRWMYLFCLG